MAERLDHLSEASLAAYAAGDTSVDQDVSIEAHVRICSGCEARLRRAAQLELLLERAAFELATSSADGQAQKVPTDKRRGGARRIYRELAAAVSMAACACLTMIALGPTPDSGTPHVDLDVSARAVRLSPSGRTSLLPVPSSNMSCADGGVGDPLSCALALAHASIPPADDYDPLSRSASSDDFGQSLDFETSMSLDTPDATPDAGPEPMCPAV